MEKPTFSSIDPPPVTQDLSFESTSNYRLLHRLGRGGMGEVWLAERRSAGDHVQLVALKFLSDTGPSSALAAEGRRMSRLSHDNIVPFVDSGHDSGGRFFVAMAYIDGVDLTELREMIGFGVDAVHRAEASVRIPDSIVGFVIFMVLRALHHAHTFRFGDNVTGLVHRDVSPGNILIDEAAGFVKLTDFGVAVRQGDEMDDSRIAGKVPYMAPEALLGETVDGRTDLYSLGLVAYEMLTGFNPNVLPSQLNSVIGAITNIMLALEKPLIPPHEVVEGIEPRLSAMVMRLLAKDRADRYPSAEEAITDITEYLYQRGIGPTTAALSCYMKILRHPELELDDPSERLLQFLRVTNGEIETHPTWRLNPSAAAALARGDNPGRES